MSLARGAARQSTRPSSRAAGDMVLSSVSVVLNALRLRAAPLLAT